MAVRFPADVKAFIIEHASGRSARELVQLLNAEKGTSYTESQIINFKKNHHIRSDVPGAYARSWYSKKFPEHVFKYIIANYVGVGPTEMAGRLNNLFDADYTPGQLKSFYANHHLSSGVTGYFPRGHVPANKGRKGIIHPGSEKGWFKPGHTPVGKMPIGTILVKSDGYLWRKIGEGAREWRQEHILRWEEAHGPVPEGHVIIFKDSDRTNVDLSNLACITKAQHLIMIRRGLRFTDPEFTEVGISVAKLRSEIHAKTPQRRSMKKKAQDPEQT